VAKDIRRTGLVAGSKLIAVSPQSEYVIQSEGFTYDGTHRREYRAGNYIEIDETDNLGILGTAHIGGYTSGGFQLKGDVAEVVIYNRALSTDEATKISKYLAWKWGVNLCTKKLVANGDSLTMGTGATTGYDWPRQMVSQASDESIHIYNFARSGIKIAQVVTDDNTYAANLVTIGNDNIYSAWIGTNDIQGGTSGADTYTAYVNLCNARRAEGYKVMAFTILPRTPGTYEAQRIIFNNLVIANYASFSDGLVDVGSDSRIGIAGAYSDLTYYNADGVHLNDTGYGVVASIVLPVFNSL